jgi:hypothetical protein
MCREVTRELTVWGLIAQGDYEGKRRVGANVADEEEDKR